MLTTALVPAAAVAQDVLPSGGQFTAGDGTISANGPRMDIRQTTESGIINWDGFSVGSGNQVHFDNGNGTTLNRVTGNVSTQIDGRLTATGSVFLINPAGVVVGSGGMVATGGSFVASTHYLTDTDFLDGGDTIFSGTSTAGVTNVGTIRSARGDIALIARRVNNTGTLEAPNGTAGLAAGYKVLMKDSADADGLLSVQLGGPDTEALNSGTIAAASAEIRANGGNVYALAGNTDNVVKATGVSTSGGRIFLTAGDTGKVKVTGRLKARTLPGIDTLSTPRPATEGGSVSMTGGDIAISGTIDVSSEVDGTKGGTVTAIASSGMSFSGTIEAQGGIGGSGGFVETSGESISIADTARVTTISDGGAAGTWLIDPNDLTIAASGGDVTGATIAANLAGGNVTLSSDDGATSGNGDIFVNDAIAWSADTILTLDAVRNIEINADIAASGTNAGLVLTYGGDYSFANGGTVTLSGASASLSLGGNAYTLIHNVNDLQAISGSGNYALAEDIDASAASSWNSGAGFAPIDGFSGMLAGLNHAIDGLTINRTSEGVVGMFASTSGGFRDFTLSNVSIVSGGSAGALASRINGGSGVSNIHVTGSVTSVGSGGQVGGLIGWNDQTPISDSSSTATVTGFGEVGGLVGRLRAASITDSYATGAVTGTTDYVGGLVGASYQGAALTNAYASGNVTGTTNVGGLIGGALVGGTVTANNAYWDVDSTGQSTSFAGTGISNANVYTQSTYSGFDFANTWVMIDGETRPMLQSEYSTTIFTPHQLQLMALDLGADYTLGADLDMTGAFAANSGGYYGGVWSSAGFDPIGIYSANPFTGSLDGQGHTISGLTIDRPGERDVGLFGSTQDATVSDLTLSGGSIIGNQGVGALAGEFNGGTITSVSSDISVEGSEFVGGLVGASQNFTAISLASASGDVFSSGDTVGGLIGALFEGTLSRSYATGNVSGSSLVGGLVGANGYASGGGTIDQSFATGNVTGAGYGLGGLVGSNEGAISNAYAMGNVTSTGASSATGGFVGVVISSASIENAYATGTVTGAAPVGGFAGTSGADASAIKSAYWNTETSGQASGIVVGGGDITGLTTAGLQGVLPSGFSNAVWGTGTNLYPYFNWLYPTGASAVSGFAYSDAGTTALAGADIGIVSGGSLLGSAGTGANGYYYYLALPGTLDADGALAYLDGEATQGAAFSDSVTSTGVTGLDIYGTSLNLVTNEAALSDTVANLTTALGSYTDTDLDFIDTSATQLTASGYGLYVDAASDYTLDQDLTAGGLLSLTSGGTFTIDADRTLKTTNAGSILVNSGVTWNGTGTLTLTSDDDIALDGAIDGKNGGLTLRAYGTGGSDDAGTISTGSNGTVDVGTFNLPKGYWYQVGTSLPSFEALDFRMNHSSASFVRAQGGDGSVADPYQLFDVYGLQGITNRDILGNQPSGDLGYSYQLVADIDASGTSGWNAGAGFVPVDLYGSLDGGGHTVDGLYIDRTGAGFSNAGLIEAWYTQTVSGSAVPVEIKDLSLTNAHVVGGYDSGILIGQSGGGAYGATLTNIYVSGTVSGGGYVGGVAGFYSSYASRAATNIRADVYVSGGGANSNVGGLFGYVEAGLNLTDSSFTGTVSGQLAGGLIGYTYDDGSITNSWASATVTSAGDNSNLGGLVGRLDSNFSISDSWFSGSVLGTDSNTKVGGLVGSASDNVGISNSFTSGSTVASGSSGIAGGLVGWADGLHVSDSYASGSTVASGGSGIAGGLIGWSRRANVSTSYASGLVDGALSGGLVGQSAYIYFNLADSVWDREASGQSVAVGDLGGGTVSNVDGVTSAEMKQLSTFVDHGFDVDDEGGTGAAWRIYEGNTAPLLRGFMTRLTVTGGNSTRTYDGSATSADVGTLVYGSPYDGALIFGTAGYLAANADAGVYTGGDLTLSGLYSSQFGYDLTLVSGSLAITPKALTVSVDADSKIYDGTTAATGSFGSLSGLIGGDVVNVSGSASFVFSDKNVGTSKTVTVTGIGLTGVDAGNYTLSSTAATTANITPKTLTVTALANDKVYDGTTAGTGSIGALGGLVSGDMAAVSGGSFAFSDKNVGTGKTVTVSGIGLTGADAGNYTLSSTATAMANITPKALTVTALANDKVYDGTTAGTGSVGALSGLVGGDMVAVSGGNFVFSDKNVGTDKTVTVSDIGLSGVDAGNYTIALTTTTTADITPKALTVSALADDKIYDGATAGSGSLGALSGLIGGDTVTMTGGSFAFSDRNVGTGKTVTVSGIGLTGADAGNYTLSSTATTTANITPKALTVTALANDKVYDGTTAGTGSIGALSGLIGGDAVSVSGGSFAFSDKNVGTSKAVTVSGIGLSGVDAGNYTIASTATSSADITPATLRVAANAASMTYGDGASSLGYTYDGLVGGDDASVLTGALFSSATSTSNVGSYGITQGSLSAGSNYQIAFTGADVTVTRRAVTVQADDLQRAINEANPALTYNIVSGTLVNGDQLSGSLSTVADVDSPAGTYDIDQGSLVLSGNYNLNYLGGVLTVVDEPGVPTPTVWPQTFESAPPLSVEAGDGTTVTCEPVIVRENGPIAVHPCNRTYGVWLSAAVE